MFKRKEKMSIGVMNAISDMLEVINDALEKKQTPPKKKTPRHVCSCEVHKQVAFINMQRQIYYLQKSNDGLLLTIESLIKEKVQTNETSNT